MKKLKVLQTNLTFSEALVELKAKKFIKCPEWEGYWFLKGGMVLVFTHDEKIINTPWYNGNILREDWQLVEIDKDWEEEQRNIILESFKQKPNSYTFII